MHYTDSNTWSLLYLTLLLGIRQLSCWGRVILLLSGICCTARHLLPGIHRTGSGLLPGVCEVGCARGVVTVGLGRQILLAGQPGIMGL